ncbi:unnamed protein product [Microthlaspi erraticum]|uniref:F-box domain-containing protein n=1 Tax=Microthlaspi erraticum TaxID=1685480 RepID=A0A6D2J600_9BRAS|nr:unnamed protein product [Microthlaspi erraticum]
MACRGKSKQAGSSQRLKKDRISELPDPLIRHTLSHLSTKEAVSTSLLSTRWRTQWLWVPNLELSSTNFQDLDAFVKFGESFFDSSRLSCIHKLKLALDGNFKEDDVASYLTSWIDAATKRKLQHLHVHCPEFHYSSTMPLSLYTCETLVTLKLSEVSLQDPGSVSVTLPCLKTMHLKNLWYPVETRSLSLLVLSWKS